MAAHIEEIAPDLHRVVDGRRKPEHVLKSIVDGINTGNLDTLMPLYEPEAAFATQPGNLSRGLPGVRQALAGFVAMKGKLDLNVTRVLEVSDLALVTTAWLFIGTGPDGKPVKLAAQSADVLRRQADGSWAHDLADGDETDHVEEHLFACGDCSARLHRLAALGTGLATLERQGRVSGIVSRALLNRMQRDGLHVRMYSLVPGETVPCAVFPGDDLIVTALRADFSAVEAVTLSVTGPGDSPFSQLDNVPVSRPDGEVLWATPAAVVRQMPSMRLQLTLASAGATRAELGRYVLEHSASAPPV